MTNKKNDKYDVPKGWRGGRTPDGETNDFNEYLKSWETFNKKLEDFTGLRVTAYDPSIQLSKIVDGKYIGSPVQLPLWFAKILIEKSKK